MFNLFCSKLVSTHCRAETYGPWGLIVYWNAVFLICKWDLMEPPLDFDLDIAPVRSRNYRPWSHGPTTSSRCVIDSNFLIPSLRRVSSVRISYCGKFCCQLWNGHHLSTCFGQKKVPATVLANEHKFNIDLQIKFWRPANVKLIAHPHSYESSYLSNVYPAHEPNQLKTETCDAVLHRVDFNQMRLTAPCSNRRIWW